jgi:hypothetical protein
MTGSMISILLVFFASRSICTVQAPPKAEPFGPLFYNGDADWRGGR